MSRRQELCRNFQRGCCKYGAQCRFVHASPQQQQAKPNPFGFGTASRQQQQPFGAQPQSQFQQQQPNPYGFGVQGGIAQSRTAPGPAKPFQNKWVRDPSAPTKQAEAAQPPQAAHTSCTDPESCRQQISEDFKNEAPLWKLTCYAHLRSGPCDITGDISFEELRAKAYEEGKQGHSLQSIVEGERNLQNAKLMEFTNMLNNARASQASSFPTMGSFPEVKSNSSFVGSQTNGPPVFSSFSQIGATNNFGPGSRSITPGVPTNILFGQSTQPSPPPSDTPTFGATAMKFGVSDRVIASSAKRKGSPCQLDDDDDSQGGEIEMYSGPTLPEDICCYIHSLMPMRDAARAACVSRAFLRSWRRHPHLIFDGATFGLFKDALEKNDNARNLSNYISSERNDIARDFSSKIDQILTKHSRIGVKRLKIGLVDYNGKDPCHLKRWLQIAVTPGIEELTLTLPRTSKSKYNFPYSLLCNQSGDSIRSFHLAGCSFRPTAEVGWLRRLTKLHLSDVHIMEDNLERLLSNSFALQRLEISSCDSIVCLKVPCLLQQLSYLDVGPCHRLQKIDLGAPNISSFYYSGNPDVQLSTEEKLQMKDVRMAFCGAVQYARVKLPSSMPNLETLSICSFEEVANTQMLHSKFLHLKNLMITLTSPFFSPSYDYLSLVSFLDACPSLEAVVLDVSRQKMDHISIFTDGPNLRQMREHHHDKIKRVEIIGFFSWKSLVELTCHFVENIMSLECLTLDASHCFSKCSNPGNKSGKCSRLRTDVLMEAHRAVSAIRTHIKPKVPSIVKLDVVGPCSRCHGVVTLDV